MNIENHLKKYGWYPGRKADLSGIPDSYPENLKEFLLEFGGLNFPYLAEIELSEIFIIDPKECDDYYLTLEKEFKKKFFPIGRAAGEAADIVLDEEGFLYLIGDVIVCYGQDLRKSFQRLIKKSSQRSSLAYSFREKAWEDIFGTPQDINSYDFDSSS